MRAKERLALEIFRAMVRGDRFSVVALLQGMMALRGEQKAIVALLEERYHEGVALSAQVAASPWFYKEVGRVDRKTYLAPVYELARGVKMRGEEAEKVAKVLQEATWPELRFLKQLAKRIGMEVKPEDLVWSMRWLSEHREFLNRMGVGRYAGKSIWEVKDAEAEAAT